MPLSYGISLSVHINLQISVIILRLMKTGVQPELRNPYHELVKY